MAVTIKHAKTDTISDWTQTDLDAQIALGNFPPGTTLADIVLPSDWNHDHTVTGLGTMATQNANSVAITGGTMSGVTVTGYIPTTEKGVANGVATLDSGGKVPVSQIPALGDLNYQGTWNASTNSPTLTSSVGTKGYYYVVNVAGSTNLNGITDWQIGDWAVYNGSVWQKIDNTDAVTSVNGYTGTVVLNYTDVGAFPATSTTGSGNVVLATGATQAHPTISDYESFTPTTAPSYAEGELWYDNTAHALAYFNDVSSATVHLGQDLIVKVINNTGSTIANGSPVYVTSTSSGQTYPNIALAKADVAATSAVIGLTNGAIANGAIGYVTSQGGIDGVNTGSFTVGQVLYLSPYSAGQLMNTIPPTGITVQVGVVSYVNSSTGKIYVKQTTPLAVPASIITGQVALANGGTNANLTATAGGVLYSGASALAISAAGTAGQVLTSNGSSAPTWTTPTTGTVTSVTGTAPIASSGGATPAISISQATTSTNGYLSSTDWNTFNNKQPAGSYLTSVTASSPLSGSGTSGSPLVIAQATTSTSGYLSSTDWNTFNNKQAALVSGTNIKTVNSTSLLGSGDVSVGVLTVTGTAPVVSSGGANPAISMAAANGTTNGYLTSTDWTTFNNKGSGSVTSVSVVSANGLAGTVATATTTPAITLSTTVTGLLKGNGTAISAATSGTDYAPATSGSSILYGNGSGGFSNVTVGTGLSFSAGTLSSTVTSGLTVTSTTSNTNYNLGFQSATSGTTTVDYINTSFTANPSTGNLTAPQVVASNGIMVSSKTVAASYSIASGSNAMSVGPVTVATGQSVTVPSGSRWVVL
jgi:hypothetical protein